MILRLLIIILIYIFTSILPVGKTDNFYNNCFSSKAFAEEVLKINSINFDNSDSIIFLGTSGGEELTESKITKKVLSEPDRVFFDIDNAVLTFPNKTFELKNSRLTQLKIAQNSTNPNIVRIVIWNSPNYDASKIKVLRIKNNIIIKLSSETPLQQYLTQIYKETKGSAVDYYDRTVVIPEETTPVKESDEIFNKVQQAFKEDNQEIVRPNIEQRQARLKSRFFLEKVVPKNGNVLISGIGVINVEKPFILTEPSRIVFDLPNTIVLQELRDKEIKLSDNETVKIGQFEAAKARIVIKTPNPENYKPIYSSNLQTLLIANENRLSGVNLTGSLCELTYFKEQNINESTDIINIMFSSPIIYSLNRETDKINIIIYNLANFNVNSFNSIAIANKTGFIAKQVGANIYQLTFPIKNTTMVDCYETLNASQLRFVFTKPKPVLQIEEPLISAQPKPPVSQKPNTSQAQKKESPFANLLERQKVTKKPNKETTLAAKRIRNKVILIDPGHGGNDTGALRGNVLEKDLTLAIALKVREELKAKGFTQIILTRTTDKTLSLADRVEIANSNKADIFVSIHINSSVKTEINGIETHYYSERGYDVAKILHKELMSNIQAVDRGLFKSKFYVINHTEAPAVLLELGFISNEQERNLLTSEKRQKSSAEAIADGIVNYLTESK